MPTRYHMTPPPVGTHVIFEPEWDRRMVLYLLERPPMDPDARPGTGAGFALSAVGGIVVEVRDYYSRIAIPEGVDGWVWSGFLSDAPWVNVSGT